MRLRVLTGMLMRIFHVSFPTMSFIFVFPYINGQFSEGASANPIAKAKKRPSGRKNFQVTDSKNFVKIFLVNLQFLIFIAVY